MCKLFAFLLVLLFYHTRAQLECDRGGTTYQEDHRDVPHVCSFDFRSCPPAYKCENIKGVSDSYCCPRTVRKIGCPRGESAGGECQSNSDCSSTDSCETVTIIGSSKTRKCCPNEVRHVGCPRGEDSDGDCERQSDCPETHSCETIKIVGSSHNKECCPRETRIVGCPNGESSLRDISASQPRSCSSESHCPDGYSCTTVKFVGSVAQKQCCPEEQVEEVSTCPDGTERINYCSRDSHCDRGFICEPLGNGRSGCCAGGDTTPDSRGSNVGCPTPIEQHTCGHTCTDPHIEEIGHFGETIHGGVISKPYSWPWIVATNSLSAPGRSTACAGNLIDHQWAITAAHCIPQYTVDNPTRSYLRAALWDKSNKTDGIKVNFDSVYIHPDYKYQNDPFVMQNDIALIKAIFQLGRSLEYTEKVGAACLKRDDASMMVAGEEVIAVGWGRHGFDQGPADDLKEISMPVLDYEQYCDRSFNTKKSVFCTKEDGRSVCQGDHGGPALYHESDKLWYQYGVGSYVSKNCHGTATFTRVANYCSWIESTTGMQLCK